MSETNEPTEVKPDYMRRVKDLLNNNDFYPSDSDLEDITDAVLKADAWASNVGKEPHRLPHNPIEQAFHDAWIKENEPKAGINHGHGILQDLFIERKFNPLEQYKFDPITSRERMIVATVIQWLGTNCGMCFLNTTLARVGMRIAANTEQGTTIRYETQKKDALTLEMVTGKMTYIDMIKHYKPEWTDEECDHYLWNFTCFPFSAESLIEQLNLQFANK